MMLMRVFLAAIAFITLTDVAEGIIAGKYAKDGDFPYSVVILQVNPVKEGDVLCGGVLVTSQHVFTSCHCVGEFGKIEDVTEIDWEPLETGYTINVAFDDSEWSIESIEGGIGRDYDEKDSEESGSSRSRRIQAYPINATSNASTTDLPDIMMDRSANGATSVTMSTLNRTSTTKKVPVTTKTLNRTSTNKKVPVTTKIRASTTMSTIAKPTDERADLNLALLALRKASETLREGFIPFNLKNILLVAGTIWIYRFGKGQVRVPSSSFQHPSCNNNTYPWDFDFGVYQSERFEVNEFLIPMTLWHRDREIMRKRFDDMINDGAICTTVGWGATQKKPGEPGTILVAKNDSEKLKTTQVKLVADSICNELLCRRPHRTDRVCKGLNFQWSDRGIVCASHLSQGDSCSGDDGNALVCNNHVVGFANSGVECFEGVPRFYTRLDYATDFYHSTVSSSSCRMRYAITTVMDIIMSGAALLELFCIFAQVWSN